jgi:hypothetical protein
MQIKEIEIGRRVRCNCGCGCVGKIVDTVPFEYGYILVKWDNKHQEKFNIKMLEIFTGNANPNSKILIQE